MERSLALSSTPTSWKIFLEPDGGAEEAEIAEVLKMTSIEASSGIQPDSLWFYLLKLNPPALGDLR